MISATDIYLVFHNCSSYEIDMFWRVFYPVQKLVALVLETERAAGSLGIKPVRRQLVHDLLVPASVEQLLEAGV